MLMLYLKTSDVVGIGDCRVISRGCSPLSATMTASWSKKLLVLVSSINLDWKQVPNLNCSSPWPNWWRAEVHYSSAMATRHINSATLLWLFANFLFLWCLLGAERLTLVSKTRFSFVLLTCSISELLDRQLFKWMLFTQLRMVACGLQLQRLWVCLIRSPGSG